MKIGERITLPQFMVFSDQCSKLMTVWAPSGMAKPLPITPSSLFFLAKHGQELQSQLQELVFGE
jgi:hypothetical protein